MTRPVTITTTVTALVAAAATAVGGCAPAPTGSPAPAAPRASATPSALRSAYPPERPAPGDHDLHLTWAGKDRSYALHAPPRYRSGASLPLVVVLHYRDGDTPTMKAMTRFDQKADREGFLVAYPVGEGGAMNAMICCGDNDDVGFVRAMVDHLVRAWGADRRRLYATGISNGADMSFRMGVEAPGLFAAIAPVAGGYLGERASSDPGYVPHRPLSVVSFVGLDDRSKDRVLAGLANWRRKVRCTAAKTVAVNATVRRSVARCADGSEVVSYTLAGEGHRWPGGAQEGLGDPDAQINAVEVIWSFFRAHPARR
jgi:polyhydroxybutyrate depolymerase